MIATTRAVGLIILAGVLPYRGTEDEGALAWLGANASILFLMFPFLATLWLALTGVFGYGSPQPRERAAGWVFLFALAVRELYARHGVQGNGVHFHWDIEFYDPHSLLYGLYTRFVQSLASDGYTLLLHVNGIVSAFATLPLYRFVRQRTQDANAALLTTMLYVAHPLLAQMGPSDAPYTLCFTAWFSGLTLLSASQIGAKELIGGATLLGIAATCRAEGSLYLLASLLLLPVPTLIDAARKHVQATLAALGIGITLIAAQIIVIFPGHMTPEGSLPELATPIGMVIKAAFWSLDYNDPLVVGLVLVGAWAGLVQPRLRLGLGAALGIVIVVWPFATTTLGGYTILHRLSPACALQVIAAGVGAAWLTTWLPTDRTRRWAGLFLGSAAALFLLVAHRQEIREPNALTDEFWMLRNHLAPGGVVDTTCKLLLVGEDMDTDFARFEEIVPGMKCVRCDREDCRAVAAAGGCLYYLRGINCFHSWTATPPACLEHGKTMQGGYLDCIKPRCVEMEAVLDLEIIEQRTVDVHSVFNFPYPLDPHFPHNADLGLYRVRGVKD